jgi:hypothetical protein
LYRLGVPDVGVNMPQFGILHNVPGNKKAAQGGLSAGFQRS